MGDIDLLIEDYSKKYIEPAVDALCLKMKEGCESPILLKLPESLSENDVLVTYGGLTLRCSQGYHIEAKLPFLQISVAYTSNIK